jgi:hypothetical protein
LSNVRAADHSVTAARTPLPDGFAAAVAEEISEQSVRVVRGSSRTVCEIWLGSKLRIAEDFQPSAEVLYPFQPGALIGAIQFPRRGSDFRDQRIDAGLYTLRYGQQPVDGNHVGTSPTRDFLCLIRAEDDPSADPLDGEKLIELSAAAAGSTHPLLLCLQKAEGDLTAPAISHDADHDWWIVRLASQVVRGDQTVQLPIALVVVGQAAE